MLLLEWYLDPAASNREHPEGVVLQILQTIGSTNIRLPTRAKHNDRLGWGRTGPKQRAWPNL